MFSTTGNAQYEKKEHRSFSIYHVVNTLHALKKKKKKTLIQGGRYYFLQFYR